MGQGRIPPHILGFEKHLLLSGTCRAWAKQMRDYDIQFLTPEDYGLMANTIESNPKVFAPWFKDVMDTLWATGARPAEIVGRNERIPRSDHEGYVREHHGLRGRDVMSGHILNLVGKNTAKNNKGLKARQVLCTVYEVYDMLQERADNVLPDEHLFGLGPHPETPHSDGYTKLRGQVKLLRDRMPRRLSQFTVKWLRHSWAIHSLRNRVDLVSVQRQLGHKDLETTAVYLRFAPQDKEAVMNAWNHGDARLEVTRCPKCKFTWKYDRERRERYARNGGTVQVSPTPIARK